MKKTHKKPTKIQTNITRWYKSVWDNQESSANVLTSQIQQNFADV